MIPFTLPDKVYAVIKWLLAIVVPAFGTLYSIFAGELGLGHTETVLKLLFATATFFGIILGISQVAYNQNKAREADRDYTP